MGIGKGISMGMDMTTRVQAELAAMQADAAALGRVLDAAPAASTADAGSPATGFAESFKNAFHHVNAQDRAAGAKMADVDAGRSDDLVGAMLASQQASLSFSMLLQVRNKVVGAVEDLIKLPL